MKNKKLREQMLLAIVEWERSGQTQEQYCKVKGMSIWKFKSWRHIFNKEKKISGGGFIKIQSIESVSRISKVKVMLPNGIQLEYEQGLSGEDYKMLLG